ncbi:sigma-70 family RNA polymerase sigma factor [Tissierella sp. Yu-01]|uniref:sigma-70 family RNA polymerase sigma factor n=1 Tax=Tissierella sp. Yu-01 TaxID=3035694 RepID=UPI00240D271F|nr:sigma-70 family RNA polymerase sigma factor [Tissierella sp. Yu-01]WFA08799.1 sigma-70 family RNA polymerase sigma factor [Tissierella sp. Yu-01]
MQQIANIMDKKESDKTIYSEVDFAYIFETYYKRVYNYIYYRVNSNHVCDDLTSQIFEKVMIRIDTYNKEKAPFEVWLFGIAKNVVNDYYRDLKKHKIFSIDSIKELVSSKKSPEDLIEIEETKGELLKALKILDLRERNIIALKFGANLKNVEVAEVLNLTESNVGVILYRSMKKLKKELEKEE